MNFLINCSNLKKGGGLQVADSFCLQLFRFPQHSFIVVLSSYLSNIEDLIEKNPNVTTKKYNITNNLSNLLLGRDSYLDYLVSSFHIDAVITLFGPSRWRPRVPHLCGFARAQLILKDSPYYKTIKLRERLIYKIWTYYFTKSSSIFYTENAYISNKLPHLLGKGIQVYTVTNYYNQIFDNPSAWEKEKRLPSFDGITIISISSPSPHKNYPILVGVTDYLKKKYPLFKFRFVLTQTEQQMPFIPNTIKDHFVFLGTVNVRACPFLYQQSNIMFMPTLMECFSATYPEAMRMGIPIVTTDLGFAHSLCGNAACYYAAMDPCAAADAIYHVATDKSYAQQLIDNGRKQLLLFDNYEQRANKLVGLLEKIAR